MKVAELFETTKEDIRAAQRRLLKAFGSKHIGGHGDPRRGRVSGARSANTKSFPKQDIEKGAAERMQAWKDKMKAKGKL